MKLFTLLIIACPIFSFTLDNPVTILKQNDYSVIDKLGNVYLINKDEIEKYKDGIAIKKI